MKSHVDIYKTADESHASGKPKSLFILLLTIGLLFLTACSNNPHPSRESGSNYYYTDFDNLPKHLEPARSYSSDEYALIALVYEPPFQYHYLKRPYELVPLTLTEIPEPVYLDDSGTRLPADASEVEIKKVRYTFKLKKGIMYQNHPCFALKEDGSPYYTNLTEEDVSDIEGVPDFEQTGTREVIASDYVHQIKRMADTRKQCPILATLSQSIIGLGDFSKSLTKQVADERARRKDVIGIAYNRESDEESNPIDLKLMEKEIEGVRVLDDYTFQIDLSKPYPQLLMWMAMPFFAPMPPEADEFYNQTALIKKDIDLNHWPVGSGPYQFEEYQANKRIVLTRNENFNHESYPTEGAPGDMEVGLLEDAGKTLPFIDKVVMVYEKESIPRWNKFMQGYYDASAISSDNFDSAVQFVGKAASLTENLEEMGISMATAVSSTIIYYGFNMKDPVLGGNSEKSRKLRQALSIAIDIEEFLQIFANGRGIPAMGPLVPGVPGYIDPLTKEGMNPYVYNWDEERGRPVRKPIEEAKKLLAEAGYPDGNAEDGSGPLILHFDTMSTGPGAQSYLTWLRKQFDKLNIQLKVRAVTYPQFQERMDNGTAQIFRWGWNADYPDAENLLFLLYGPFAKAGEDHGENASNYQNEEFDKYFDQMKNMADSPERREIIAKMLEIVRRECPWVWSFYPIGFGLQHEWLKNYKPNVLANNARKYHRIDSELRQATREKWNEPIVWPLVLVFAASLIFIVPAAIRVQRANKQSGGGAKK